MCCGFTTHRRRRAVAIIVLRIRNDGESQPLLHRMIRRLRLLQCNIAPRLFPQRLAILEKADTLKITLKIHMSGHSGNLGSVGGAIGSGNGITSQTAWEDNFTNTEIQNFVLPADLQSLANSLAPAPPTVTAAAPGDFSV